MDDSMRLLCNVCGSGVDGIAFRTSCCHFYCPPCAKSTFGRSSCCAICQSRLSDCDVVEVSVGIPVAEEAVIGNMYQALLQSTEFSHVAQKLAKLTTCLTDVTSFVTSQLFHAASQSEKLRSNAVRSVEGYAQQLEKMNQRIVEQEYSHEAQTAAYDHQLRETNRALCELQEAYKEKIRKCQAWEKAYNNVRSQIGGKSSDAGGVGEVAPFANPSTALGNRSNMDGTAPFSLQPAQQEVRTFRNVTNHHMTRTFPASEVAQAIRGSFPMVSPEASHPPPFTRPMQPSSAVQQRGYVEHRPSYPALSRERAPQAVPAPAQFSAHFAAQRGSLPASSTAAKRPFFDNA